MLESKMLSQNFTVISNSVLCQLPVFSLLSMSEYNTDPGLPLLATYYLMSGKTMIFVF